MKAIVSLLFLLFCRNLSAQSINTSVRFDKTEEEGLMLYLPYSQEVAEGTILTKLKETGYEPQSSGSFLWKQNKENGFYAFKGVTLKSNKGDIVDLYFKVDRRGSKKDAQSVIYMLTSKGGDSFVTNSSDATLFTAAQNFLNGFTSETATYKHSLDVTAQEEAVNKAEKKLADLITEESDLNKKLIKLQEDIRKNKETQVTQQTTIESEKKKLAELKLTKS